jgi:hypothetical protein
VTYTTSFRAREPACYCRPVSSTSHLETLASRSRAAYIMSSCHRDDTLWQESLIHVCHPDRSRKPEAACASARSNSCQGRPKSCGHLPMEIYLRIGCYSVPTPRRLSRPFFLCTDFCTAARTRVRVPELNLDTLLCSIKPDHKLADWSNAWSSLNVA